jgi:leucyl-tRNA synthetase
LGISFDWDREINTTDPDYYKWTQWIFIQFFKKGLAYKAKVPVNWCPNDKIVLANEEVVGGKCERCGTEVQQKLKSQWMLKITAYAEKLLRGLREVDYLPEIKLQQTNWIGKSEGAEIDFPIKNANLKINVFTTRPDTLYGATYIVLAPEHFLVEKLKEKIKNWEEVKKYIEKTAHKTEEERLIDEKEKTGVELKGITAINPANKKEIPVFIADYVLLNYGTGAIMAVPAHDKRDFDFAQKFNLPIITVIQGNDKENECYEGAGKIINSGNFNGMDSERAKWEIVKSVKGKRTIKYHIRDWVFSRQRYWGEPIPIVNCQKCGFVPVPEEKLPVILPKIKNYKPNDDGESPLASIKSWVNTKCPNCNSPAKRETDVMPNWAGSSWYFLRYTDPKNKKEFANFKKLKYWMPVDWYNGGMEHVTLHLLYSRFWNIFLYDLGLVPYKEPYKKRTAQGMILGEHGVKMSKSKGNVINPDTIVEKYGADSTRVYEMFMGPFNQSIAWNTKSIDGAKRFIWKIWEIGTKKHIKNFKNKDLEKALHKTIKKVSEDIENTSFHTAISSLMIFANILYKEKNIPLSLWKNFLKILAPFAPHITEELWMRLGEKKSIHLSAWPKFDKNLIEESKIQIVIQINGKKRGVLEINKDEDEESVQKKALRLKNISKIIDQNNIKRVVYVKNKIINFVI